MTDNPPSPQNPAPRRPPMLRVGSPASLLAAIPSLLGFHPARSLVVVGAGPPRGRIEVAFRYDLPEPPDRGAAAQIAAHAAGILARQQLTQAVVVGYGPGPMVTPVADALVGELRRAEITLHDMLRVENGRYWSYSCQDPHCCPAEGVPFDPGTHPTARAMTAAGSKALRDRAALAATIAPLGGLAEESMRQATGRAERRGASLRRAGPDLSQPGGSAQRAIDAGLRAVTEAVATYRRGGRFSSDDQIAWLAVSLADLRVRDDAWARMLPEHAAAHLRLWTDVVRRAPARYVPAPASLLAFTAWQAGNGTLANLAAERALAADPGYSMALLLLDAVSAGVPPSAARLPMTPDEVAASYAGAADQAASKPGAPAGESGQRAGKSRRPAASTRRPGPVRRTGSPPRRRGGRRADGPPDSAARRRAVHPGGR
jgi:Domain of unknown function (DUF4192)